MTCARNWRDIVELVIALVNFRINFGLVGDGDRDNDWNGYEVGEVDYGAGGWGQEATNSVLRRGRGKGEPQGVWR